MVTLEPMTEAEFQSFVEPAIAEYAQGHVTDGQWAEEEALEKSRKEFGSGSLEQDGSLGSGAMEEEEQARGRSISTDLEKENVMRTKRASGFRRVLFHRSTWAVSPVSFPTAVCCSLGITAA